MAVARTHAARRLLPVLLASLLAGLSLIPAAAPVTAQTGIDARLRQRFQEVIDLARPAVPVPGISAAVATPSDAWTGVTGRARLDTQERVQPDTPFAIGSVTKTFVAAVIMQLREEGRLSLSDHLSRWETRVPNATRITVRQLLSHTSGVRDMWWNPHYKRRVEGRPSHVWTYAEVRAMIGPPRFAPGTRFEYSNSNYVLLGRIIRLVTGHSVAHEIRARLLDPLGLVDTWYQGAEVGPRPVAMGYLRRSGAWIPQGNGTGLRPTTSIATFFGPAGAMVSTARDLTVWARALYGGHVVHARSLELMTRFNSHDYGLGTRRKDIGGRVAWGHGGSLDGFETAMWYLPSLDSAVVVIWNRREVDPDPTAAKLARRLVNALDPDTTPPVIGAPRFTLASGVAVPAGHAPVRVTWPAAHDSQGAVTSYQLRRRVGTGPWQSVRLASPLARGRLLTLATGSNVVVAVRARDDRGNVSDWVESVPVVARFVDESGPGVDRGPGWYRRAEPDALGGHVLASTVSGSHLRLMSRVLGIAVVAPRGQAMTRATIRVDDRPATAVDLHASRHRPRMVVLARRWAGAAADHGVRISVRQAPAPRVEIDGFLVLESPLAP